MDKDYSAVRQNRITEIYLLLTANKLFFMKLSDHQRGRPWGENGPHSQARLVFESCIFKDEVAVNLLKIEVSINPLTFEIIEKAEASFRDDIEVGELMDYCHYSDEDEGYIAIICFGAFTEDESLLQDAQKSLESIQKAIIRMHEYAIDVLKRAGE